VVGLLRRLRVLDERELRFAFMQARDAYLDSKLAALPAAGAGAGDAAAYAKRYVDTLRDQLFDMTTQYRACFATAAGDGADDGVLPGWMALRIGACVAMLERTLPRIPDGASLAALLAHVGYFALSLARVGADFQGPSQRHQGAEAPWRRPIRTYTYQSAYTHKQANTQGKCRSDTEGRAPRAPRAAGCTVYDGDGGAGGAAVESGGGRVCNGSARAAVGRTAW
jgi:hypothetical protein